MSCWLRVKQLGLGSASIIRQICWWILVLVACWARDIPTAFFNREYFGNILRALLQECRYSAVAGVDLSPVFLETIAIFMDLDCVRAFPASLLLFDVLIS